MNSTGVGFGTDACRIQPIPLTSAAGSGPTCRMHQRPRFTVAWTPSDVRTRRRAPAFGALLTAVGALVGCGTDAVDSIPATSTAPEAGGGVDADRQVHGWYLGSPIRPAAIVPPAYGGDGPEAPAEDVPDLTVYLVGPVDGESPVGPSIEIPTPDGEMRVLPPHQQTHDAIVDESTPYDAIGVFVVPGPSATDADVRVADQPDGSVVGAPLATAVRIGPTWVKLSNHLAIEHGIARGLLATVPFEYGGLMWTTFVDDRPFELVCELVSPPSAGTGSDTDDGDHGDGFEVFGYYLGMPIRPTAILPAAYGGPGPDGPSDDVPDLTVYLAGPFDPEAPAAPSRSGIPTPDGPRNLPSHIQVHDRVVPADRPHDAMGVFVVAAEGATDSVVRVHDEIDDSVAGAPLTTHVRIGDAWMPLDSHLVIDHGVAIGALALVEFEFGGLMWHTFDDPDLWLACDPG